MSQLLQQPAYRDYFGVWQAAAVPAIEGLNNRDCFRPSQYSAPRFNDQLIAPLQYVQAQLALPAGGYIWAFAGRRANFSFLVTDLTLNRPLSNSPIEAQALLGSPTGSNGCTPFYLPQPYPIVAPGLFSVECWSVDPDDTVRAEVVLLVVEPKKNV